MFGAKIYLFDKVGKDSYGIELLNYFKSQNINTEFINQKKLSKIRVAVVTINSNADNSIIFLM